MFQCFLTHCVQNTRSEKLRLKFIKAQNCFSTLSRVRLLCIVDYLFTVFNTLLCDTLISYTYLHNYLELSQVLSNYFDMNNSFITRYTLRFINFTAILFNTLNFYFRISSKVSQILRGDFIGFGILCLRYSEDFIYRLNIIFYLNLKKHLDAYINNFYVCIIAIFSLGNE